MPLPDGLRGRLSPRAWIALAAGVVLVAGILLVSHWASEPTWVTLYRDLDLSDAAQVGDHLTKADIRHQLGAGGTEIKVAADDIARARVALAKDGLPANGRPGLELFDKPSWGMTDFTQRVTYQRALEGELARTVGALRGVARAQVHLVLASDGVLSRETRPASASVVLTLKPGVSLAADAVQGITYIVSNSVEQLPAENVAVMDDAGHVMSAPNDEALGAGLTSRQLELQRGLEGRLAQKIESLLATVVGEGNARAQVAAVVDFDQRDRTIETFDPETQVLQTEQRAEGKDVAPVATGGVATGSGGDQTIVSNTYQNSRKVERSVGNGGDIRKLTVAVLVDEKSIRKASASLGGSGALARLESMVRDAVGVDSTRGDRLTVLAVPFEVTLPAAGGTDSKDAARIKANPMVTVERFVRPIAGILAVIVLGLLGWRALGGARQEPSPLAPLDRAGGGGAVVDLARAVRANDLSGMPRGADDPSVRTEDTAQVLRAWLGDRS